MNSVHGHMGHGHILIIMVIIMVHNMGAIYLMNMIHNL